MSTAPTIPGYEAGPSDRALQVLLARVEANGSAHRFAAKLLRYALLAGSRRERRRLVSRALAALEDFR